MSATVLYMSMSLDGFVAGPNESLANGLGDGGERLHEWVGGVSDVQQLDGADREVLVDFLSTGAVLAGRGPSNRPEAGMETITTACPSSSSAAISPPPGLRSGLRVTYLSDLEDRRTPGERGGWREERARPRRRYCPALSAWLGFSTRYRST